jgi:ABC-type dipeptide/oligopeptide/nickel transport system ATPase component
VSAIVTVLLSEAPENKNSATKEVISVSLEEEAVRMKKKTMAYCLTHGLGIILQHPSLAMQALKNVKDDLAMVVAKNALESPEIACKYSAQWCLAFERRIGALCGSWQLNNAQKLALLEAMYKTAVGLTEDAARCWAEVTTTMKTSAPDASAPDARSRYFELLAQTCEDCADWSAADEYYKKACEECEGEPISPQQAAQIAAKQKQLAPEVAAERERRAAEEERLARERDSTLQTPTRAPPINLSTPTSSQAAPLLLSPVDLRDLPTPPTDLPSWEEEEDLSALPAAPSPALSSAKAARPASALVVSTSGIGP